MRNQPIERDLSLSAGWLYADILIALAVLFLVATASARGVGSSGETGASHGSVLIRCPGARRKPPAPRVDSGRSTPTYQELWR